MAAGTCALGLGALGWALVEARAYTLRRFEVPILPRGSAPIKLLHVSDLHLLPGDRRRIEWVKHLAEHEPDIVVTTGDNISHVDAVPAVAEALSPFLGLPGAFVTGSNDFHPPVLKNPLKYLRKRPSPPKPRSAPELPTEELIEMLSSGRWAHIDNARAQLKVRGTRIALVGTGDAHMEAAHYPPPRGDLAPAEVRIGVTHAPYQRVLERMRLDGVELALAGHTHGGQVCVPGYGALVTNCDLDRRMAKGLHRWPQPSSSVEPGGQMWLHVSAGLGTSPFTPIRFACRPEASLLTLTST